MSAAALLAVAIGAVLGAWLRWGLAAAGNHLLPSLPLGTLVANLLGGLLMGAILAAETRYQLLATELRLFAVTGFLGALTTFSAFSGEAVALLLRQQYAWFAGHVALHVAGTLAMTLAGYGLLRAALRV